MGGAYWSNWQYCLKILINRKAHIFNVCVFLVLLPSSDIFNHSEVKKYLAIFTFHNLLITESINFESWVTDGTIFLLT